MENPNKGRGFFRLVLGLGLAFAAIGLFLSIFEQLAYPAEARCIIRLPAGKITDTKPSKSTKNAYVSKIDFGEASTEIILDKADAEKLAIASATGNLVKIRLREHLCSKTSYDKLLEVTPVPPSKKLTKK